MTSTTPSYWCYRCSRFFRVLSSQGDSVVCPNCESRFVEEINNPPRSQNADATSNRRFPAAAMYMLGNRSSSEPNSGPALRHSWRASGDRSPFNPLIVMRGGPSDGDVGYGGERGGFELYYDDGAGSGLRPLPESMSEFLLGSGFDRLLEQLSQVGINGIGRYEHPSASKIAIESMPTIGIVDSHVAIESHCAVCKDAFQLGSEAREMPCKHIYHSDCILPWLSLQNSCPVCRHELPDDAHNSAESERVEDGQSATSIEEETVGLTIWRLPGGGFAVGRFSSGRRGGEREVPVVYTEMDGGFNNGGLPRRISWASREGRGRERGGLGRVARYMFACFGGSRSSSSSNSSSSSQIPGRSRSMSLFGSSSRLRMTWNMESNRETRRWR